MSATEDLPVALEKIRWRGRQRAIHVARGLIAPAILATLVLALFSRVLFQSGLEILASPSQDLTRQFLAWREYGFSKLSEGTLPLWNPYVFGGSPYFAGFQTALLYPPNWLHLFLPLATAINWTFTLHVFLAGYFMYLWCRSRGTSIAGGILAGIMFMFSGAFYLHIYAGHLPHVCVMVWIPLVFLSIEKLAESGSYKWCFVGIAAMSMAILGGFPQYVYYTGLISLLYVMLLLYRSPNRVPLIAGYLIIMVGATLITAVQLLAGAQAARESIRADTVTYNFASSFAFPPENVLTLLCPNVFGKLPIAGDPRNSVTYFGRYNLWEMSLYVSVAGFALAIYGAVVGRRKHARILILTAVASVLALGSHLPIYRVLYDYLPVYGNFRAVCKFTFFVTLFLCVLAADGFDQLRTARLRSRPIVSTLFLICTSASLLFLLSMSIARSGSVGLDGLWGGVLKYINDSNEPTVISNYLYDANFIRVTALAAARSFDGAAITLVLAGIVIFASCFDRRIRYVLIGLATAELFTFALGARAISQSQISYPAPWLSAIRSRSDDFRVLNAPLPNGQEVMYQDQGVVLGIQNLWGYDPDVLKRYAETMAASQGIDPDQVDQNMTIHGYSLNVLQMLRCRFILFQGNGTASVSEVPAPMAVAQIVNNWLLRPTRNQALATITSKQFDPHRQVVLETPPAIVPTSINSAGTVQVVSELNDSLEIRASVPSPSLLLITNNYSEGWRVIPLEGASQPRYEIQPANYTQMVIPLQAGEHHLRIEYSPSGFRMGKRISIVALIAYAVCLLTYSLIPHRCALQSETIAVHV